MVVIQTLVNPSQGQFGSDGLERIQHSGGDSETGKGFLRGKTGPNYLITLYYSLSKLFLKLFSFSWFIKGDYNARINITFHDFDLELSKTCLPYDYVKVSDMCNKAKHWSTNLGTGDNVDGFCGNMTSFTVTSRCENIRVEFRSDDSITGRGFNATYEIIPFPSESENH